MRYCANCGADLGGTAPDSTSIPQQSASNSAFWTPVNITLIVVAVLAAMAIVSVVLASGLVGAFAPSPTPTATPLVTAVPPTPMPTPCVNEAAFNLHRNNVVEELTAAAGSLSTLDIAEALTHLRVAASENRSMADEVEARDPTAAAHFRRSADAIDSATTTVAAFDFTSATAWLEQANNETTQGIAAVTNSLYCR